MSIPLVKRQTGRILALGATLLFCMVMSSEPEALTRADTDARSIVERADRIRFPARGFQVDVTIRTLGPDREEDVRKYRVLSKGNDNTLVLTTAPAIDRGQIMLMRGDDLWMFMPSISQPIRLPLSQRLTGQVANGDIARANFGGDYHAKLLRTEAIGGQEHYVLELTAARRSVTYHRVVYWVNRSNYRPHKAEFYAASGRLLKRAHYREFEELGGAVRPTQLVLEDMLRQGERSIMEYANMKGRDLPDKVFTKHYLKKLQ